MILQRNFEDFRFVTTESDFRKFLRRGYAGGVTQSTNGSTFSFDPIVLTKRSEIHARAGEVARSEIQLGEPVSILWDPRLLSAVQQDIFELDTGDLEVHALLPLVAGTFTLGFKSKERERLFMLEMQNGLDSALIGNLGHPTIDPNLLSTHQTQQESHKSLFSILESPHHREISEETVRDSLRLDRLHGAAELAIASEGGSEDVDLVRALIDPSNSSFRGAIAELAEVRWNKSNSASLVSIASRFVLGLPVRMTISPMTIEEKSDLVLDIRQHSSSNEDDRMLLEELLHKVRSDEGLNDLLTRTDSHMIQGLIVFLSNNRDPRDVAQLKPKNFGVDPLALSVCAFLTGLRYPRESLPRDIVWGPLRMADVMDYTSAINGSSWGERAPRRKTDVVENELYFDTHRFQRRLPVDVLEISLKQQLLRVVSKTGISAHNSACKLIVHDRTALMKCTRIDLHVIEQNMSDQFVRQGYLHYKKASKGRPESWNWVQFSNREIAQYIDTCPYLEIKVNGQLWVELTDGNRVEYPSCVVQIPVNSLELAGIGDPKNKGKKLLRLLQGSFRRQVIGL